LIPVGTTCRFLVGARGNNSPNVIVELLGLVLFPQLFLQLLLSLNAILDLDQGVAEGLGVVGGRSGEFITMLCGLLDLRLELVG
jgi:hypothetical protein